MTAGDSSNGAGKNNSAPAAVAMQSKEKTCCLQWREPSSLKTGANDLTGLFHLESQLECNVA
jgi:hypothetical protein